MVNKKPKPYLEVPPGMKLIFRPWRRDKNGKIMWAKTYGLRAWPLIVKK